MPRSQFQKVEGYIFEEPQSNRIETRTISLLHKEEGRDKKVFLSH
jgi:hypothetical protein